MKRSNDERDARIDRGDLVRKLEEVVAKERAKREKAESVTEAPETDRVEEILRDAQRAADAKVRHSRRRLLLIAVACVVILGGTWLLKTSGFAGSGKSSFELVYPPEGSDVDSFDRIEWAAAEPERTDFSIRVWARDGDVLLLEERAVGETHLELDEKVTREWPREIRIEIEWTDADGKPVSAQGSARRASP